MKELTFHHVQGKGGGNGPRLFIMDEPGQGGACHEYAITSGEAADDATATERNLCDVHFQNGPIQEFGVNGVQQEDLLAIVIDRLRAFQAGPFANKYNAAALEAAEASLAALNQRTIDRLARGVEEYNKQ